MKNISNIGSIPKEYMFDHDFKSKLKTILIGDDIGYENIYVNMDYIRPGSESVKHHSHLKQEEFFLIISGKGILRVDSEKVLIGEGDVISKPAGKDITHQFINNSSEILQILDIGIHGKEDIITYPDENIYYLKNKNHTLKSND